MEIDSCYRDLAEMMEIYPLEVTTLRRGVFQDYYNTHKERGAPLAQRKPSRMNATDAVITELLNLDGKEVAYV